MLWGHGESGNVDEGAIASEMPILRTLLSAYPPSDRFKAEKFALFYSLSLSTTIGPKRILGIKKKKKRLMFLACVSADGSEKTLPIAMGPSKNPRCFWD